MKFEEQYELICKFKDGSIGVDVYESYEEAYDAAILKAASNLPEEILVCFQINKSYINKALAGG